MSGVCEAYEVCVVYEKCVKCMVCKVYMVCEVCVVCNHESCVPLYLPRTPESESEHRQGQRGGVRSRGPRAGPG